MKDGLEETPTISRWLQEVLSAGSNVGIDSWMNTIANVRGLKDELEKAGLQLCIGDDPADELWENRPSIPTNPIEIQPLEYAGETCESKIARLREALQEAGAEGTVVSQLDEIAWLLNLRGTDVHCNPVFVAEVTLFTNPEKITTEVAAYLKENNIKALPYSALTEALEAYKGETLLLAPNSSNWNLQAHLPETCKVIDHNSLIAPMKAIKNETEIRGFRNAMIRDGVAMVKFLCWLKKTMESGNYPTEIDVDQKLTALRAEQPLFRDTRLPGTDLMALLYITKLRLKRMSSWNLKACSSWIAALSIRMAPRISHEPSPLVRSQNQRSWIIPWY